MRIPGLIDVHVHLRQHGGACPWGKWGAQVWLRCLVRFLHKKRKDAPVQPDLRVLFEQGIAVASPLPRNSIITRLK